MILGDPAVSALEILPKERVLFKSGSQRARTEEEGVRGLPVFLADDVLQEAYSQAHAEGLTVGDWVNRVLGAHLNHLSTRSFLQEVISSWEEALPRARQEGNRLRELCALHMLGRAYRAAGNLATARTRHEEQLQLARAYENQKYEHQALGYLGLVWRDLGDDQQALGLWQELLQLAQARGDKKAEGKALGNLANVRRDLGDPAQAIQLFEQRIVYAQQQGDRLGIAMGSWNLGETYEQQGNLALAVEKMQVRVEYEEGKNILGAAERAARVAALARQI